MSGTILNEETRAALIAAAREASRSAYAPYSDYHVGAAILTTDGAVYTGCNVENASYGAAICAERTAAVKAVSDGHRKFAAIAVTGSGDTPALPCGICRQVLSEFMDADAEVIVISGGAVEILTLGELLPRAFKL